MTPQPDTEHLTGSQRDELLAELRLTRVELRSSLHHTMLLCDKLVELTLVIVREMH